MVFQCLWHMSQRAVGSYHTPPQGIGETFKVGVIILLDHVNEERREYQSQEANVHRRYEFLKRVETVIDKRAHDILSPNSEPKS